METITEANDKLLVESITERVETTHESYQSTSVEGKIVEENRTVVYESTQEIMTTFDQEPIENNSFFQPVDGNFSTEENKINSANEENSISHNLEEPNLIGDVIENDPTLILATESISDVINEKLDVKHDAEPTKEAQQEGRSNEYMLEHHTENVYMPEQQQEVARLASEQVYATEMISDDSQDNNATFSHINLTVEEGTETMPVIKQSELNERENDLKRESSNAESVSVDKNEAENENENQNVDENVGSEALTVEESMEEAFQGSTEDEGVKKEATLVEVDVKVPDDNFNSENQPVTENTQEAGNLEQAMEVDQALDDNNELVDNIEPTNVTQPTSETVTLQSYTFPEGLEVSELQEGEYTIVEGPSSLDMSASNPPPEVNSDGSLVLLQNYEQAETFEEEEEEEEYIAELRGQAESRQSTSSASSYPKRRRGRKPTHDIPMHVLGHDISKPVESVPNGRALPKPRLGVKVPYRNLTSQIVSKEEIEKEIMERARLKQEQAIAKGDVLFARKLTQRLARKIAPSPNHHKRVSSGPRVARSKTRDCELSDPLAIEPEEVNAGQEQAQKINNDSDLLAILEGEGDDMPVLPKEVPQPMHDDSDVKYLEREIALQQLQELPHQEPKQRIFKGRQQTKSDTKAPVLTAEASAVAKIKPGEKSSTTKQTTQSPSQPTKKSDSSPQAPSDKENTSKQTKDASATSPKRDHARIDLTLSPKKSTVEVEPQVKVNMVLKTYSRKRKTIELSEPFPESPIPKKPMLSEGEIKLERPEPPSDVYVTKSSRVIKKKVIWDPDEVAVRSPKPAKSDSPVKATRSMDREKEKVVEKKVPSVKEKSPEKKVPEKPVAKRVVTEKAVTSSPIEKKIPKAVVSKTSKIPLKNKKSLSEVDRLLMDEGAVKMLYELRNNDEPSARKKKDVYSVEHAQKEIIKKANEIKNDLQLNTSNESPKSLRKKEALPPSFKPGLIAGSGERKMSKDSTRSSLHTPPGSPGYSQSSMLVRRRSSSSISSSSITSGSVSSGSMSNLVSKDEARTRKKASGEAPKPKKVKKHDEPQQAKEAIQPKPPVLADAKPNQFRSFSVKKSNKHYTIHLNYVDDKCYCTAQVLEELTAALKRYAKDRECNVVSITSSSKAFCMGLDYASLVSEKEDVRKGVAVELSTRVRDFLLCLLNFPKVLVAGIQGECVGLGVTMLPLFDIVIASDTATFSTPYADLGCVSEAGFLLSSPHLTNHGLAAELLFTTQKLTADDVFRRGLISRLCWPEKYNETLRTILTSISKGSRQSLEATKRQLRKHLVQTTEAAINAESKLLVEHWTSAECQKSFAGLSGAGN